MLYPQRLAQYLTRTEHLVTLGEWIPEARKFLLSACVPRSRNSAALLSIVWQLTFSAESAPGSPENVINVLIFYLMNILLAFNHYLNSSCLVICEGKCWVGERIYIFRTRSQPTGRTVSISQWPAYLAWRFTLISGFLLLPVLLLLFLFLLLLPFLLLFLRQVIHGQNKKHNRAYSKKLPYCIPWLLRQSVKTVLVYPSRYQNIPVFLFLKIT